MKKRVSYGEQPFATLYEKTFKPQLTQDLVQSPLLQIWKRNTSKMSTTSHLQKLN